MQVAMQIGIEPEIVARKVVDAIKANQLYVFAHAESRDAVAARFASIAESFGEPEPLRIAAQAEFMAELVRKPG